MPVAGFRSRIAPLALLACVALPRTSAADLRVDVPSGRPADRILVFVVRGEGVSEPVSAFQDAARRTIDAHLHARTLSIEEAFVRGGTDLQSKLAECRGEDACYARLAGPVEANFLLVITASRVGELEVVGARLLDLGVVSPIGNAVDPLQPGETWLDAVPERIRAAVPPVMWDPFGVLVIGVDQPGAEISLNGKVVGVAPIDRLGWLLPGTYRVAAKKAGFKPAESTVEVARNDESTVSLTLEEESTGTSWLLWAAIGAAAAVGAAVAIGVATSGKDTASFCSVDVPGGCP